MSFTLPPSLCFIFNNRAALTCDSVYVVVSHLHLTTFSGACLLLDRRRWWWLMGDMLDLKHVESKE